MSRWLRASGLAVLTVVVGLAVRLELPVPRAAVHPARITTDTPRYCRHLAGQVAVLARAAPRAVPAEALRLGAEGRRMCARGRVRGGLMCLRRAVLLLRAPPR